MKNIGYTFISILFLINFSFILPISGKSDSIRSNNYNVELGNKSLEEIVFYVENNKITDEVKLLNSITDKIQKDFIKAIIKYKQNKYAESYSLLFSQINQTHTNLKYYEYLVKAANIIDMTKDLEIYIEKSNRGEELFYLAGLIDYFNSDYESAKKKFQSAYQKNKNSIDILIYISNSYRRLGDYKQADEYLNTAKKLIPPTSSYLAQILIAKGSLLFLSGEYEKAKEIYGKGLKLARKNSNNIETTKAELNLAMINDLQGEIKVARELFETAYKRAIKIEQKELEAIILSEWGVSFTYTNEPIEARTKYEKSYSIFKLLNNKERMALTTNNIANLFLNIGNYQAALDNYDIALKNAGQNVRIKMLSFRGQADVYTNLSNYSKALELYNKAKKISKEIKDVSSEAEINTGMGTLYYNLGKPGKALELILEKFDEINEIDHPYLKAELNQKIGIIYFALHNNDLSNKFLLASIKLSEKYEDIYSTILSKTYLAYANIQNNNIDKGRLILKEQLRQSKEHNFNQLASTQLLILSEISLSKEKINLLNNALKLATDAKDKISMIEIYYNIGQYYNNNSQYSLGEKYLLLSISLIENELSSLYSFSSLQMQFYSSYYQIYSSLANLYIKQNEIDKAYYILDKSSSRNTIYNLTAIKLAKNEDLKLVNQFYDFNWKLNNELLDG
ncbi:MAG: tetratricopeptide repeat protein, partial [Ignavibacteriae bacterium]|nr:tetratricopeptide repeat protein [Ignavibacteriota bacterium]